jgi:hypothetical protein
MNIDNFEFVTYANSFRCDHCFAIGNNVIHKLMQCYLRILFYEGFTLQKIEGEMVANRIAVNLHLLIQMISLITPKILPHGFEMLCKVTFTSVCVGWA